MRNIYCARIERLVGVGHDQLRKSEVKNLHKSVARNHQVLWLQVPVDNARFMGFC